MKISISGFNFDTLIAALAFLLATISHLCKSMEVRAQITRELRDLKYMPSFDPQNNKLPEAVAKLEHAVLYYYDAAKANRMLKAFFSPIKYEPQLFVNAWKAYERTQEYHSYIYFLDETNKFIDAIIEFLE